jgi:hypothetical protein
MPCLRARGCHAGAATGLRRTRLTRALAAPPQGGETEALARLEKALADPKWVCAFEKPQTDPSAFMQPATTVLSPYLKFG